MSIVIYTNGGVRALLVRGKGVGKTPCFPVEEGLGKPWVSQVC